MASLVKTIVSLGKLGAVAGTLGVTTSYGVWGNIDDGAKAYNDVQSHVRDIVPMETIQKGTEKGISLTVSPLTSTETSGFLSIVSVDSYNRGVQSTFHFLKKSPNMVKNSLTSLID